MAKRLIKQVRFYDDGSDPSNTRNYPEGVSVETLTDGTAFKPYTPIVQLGIQALPGTKFYINNSIDPIIVGSTGIYEIELMGSAKFSGLKFDVLSINNIKNTPSAALIVDMIYEKEDNE